MDKSLRYTDERDKTYGIAGMVITLVACDRQDILAAIDLDAEPSHCLIMSHNYGFRGNPRMSAKIVWTQSIKDLRTTVSMALGNIACRRYVLGGRALTSDDRHALREAVRSEATEYCSLERDEADTLFDSCLSYVDDLFRHAGVHSVAHSFAAQLAERRSFTAAEAIDLLARLGLR